ncbi:hypothetical protein LSCM1_00180 [Leishmania martiniquensis]|uniref:Tetratricopeptide repeat/TPR repeat n=1 Tax=Leishmania martiniquensis TaxID=1580590 RepID=A0A836K8J4_9TRYP|nr:hypothetical protein LSCM1_00180 [Leishmania martiniquensis]
MPLISFSSPLAGGARGPTTSSIAAFKVREKHGEGMRLLQKGLVCEAIQLFQEASFFDAENVRPIVALAECYVLLCDLRSAIRCYRRALWSLHKQEMDSYCRHANETSTATADIASAADDCPVDAPYSPEKESPQSDGEKLSSARSYDAKETLEARLETAQYSMPESCTSPRNGSPPRFSIAGVADVLQPADTAAHFSEHHRLLAKSASAAVIEEPVTSPSLPAPCAALTAKDIRERIAGILDALGLSLYQVGSVEQALRCATEALELLDAAAQVGEGVDDNVPASKSSQFLAEPTIALHRGVYLMALKRDEEAEALLETHFNVFPRWRPQSAALLVQLYCNRQAFLKARMMLETQEKQGAGATDSDPPTEVGGNIHDVCDAQGSTAAPTTPRPPLALGSLAVAKYLFTELYARYRATALASNDEASITRCLGIYSSDVELLFRRAQLSLAAGKHKLSIKDLFRCVRETNGEHKEAIEVMTMVLFKIGSSLNGEAEMQDAVSYYSESLKWRPDNLLVLLARGDCYTKMELFEEALADYEAVLCFEPDRSDARQRIASLHDLWGRKLFAQNQPEQAEAEFTHAINTDSRNPEFYCHRALCRLKLDQGRYALRDVLSCKELNPTAPHLRAFIARYLEPVLPLGANQCGKTPHSATAPGATVPARAALPPPHQSPRPVCTPPWFLDGNGPPARLRRRGRDAHKASAHFANDDDSRATCALPSIRLDASAQKHSGFRESVQGCQAPLHQRERGAPAPVK